MGNSSSTKSTIHKALKNYIWTKVLACVQDVFDMQDRREKNVKCFRHLNKISHEFYKIM